MNLNNKFTSLVIDLGKFNKFGIIDTFGYKLYDQRKGGLCIVFMDVLNLYFLVDRC